MLYSMESDTFAKGLIENPWVGEPYEPMACRILLDKPGLKSAGLI